MGGNLKWAGYGKGELRWKIADSYDPSQRRAKRPKDRFAMESGTFGWHRLSLGEPCSAVRADASPVQRSRHACCVLCDELFIHGGSAGSRTLSDLWRYRAATNEWERLEGCGTPSPTLQDHTMVASQNILVVFGGFPGEPWNKIAPHWEYSIEEHQWKRRLQSDSKMERQVPSNRRGHSAVLFNHVMHVYGGYMDLGGPSDEFWMLDLESGEWCLQRSAAGPGPRYEHAVALWQSRMFLHGGLQGMRASADLWACDLELKLWTRLTTRSGPGALHAHCACACVDGLLVFGGERKGCVLSEVWIFLHTGKVWTQLKLHPDMPKPQPRFQHTMATTANKPLVSHRVSAQMFTNRVFGMSDANNDLHGDFGQLEGETLPGMLLKTCKPLTIRHGSQEGTNHDESSDNLQSSLETVSPSCSVGLDHCVPDEFPVFVIGGGKSQTASSLMPEHIALGKLVLYLPIMH
uniref:rab9 effector protein with kelch motifs-like isoform X2 n=1 Tax=Myxine glutinosa TaxID=7769 RepID=UPI00358FF906